MKSAGALPVSCTTAWANIWQQAKINLEVLSTELKNDFGYLTEAQQLIDRAISDIRTLSHLLHPPLLDEAGFGSAARWFVEGFGKRSGIVTRLRMPSNLDRLPPEIETALFRILQEALTNVHRHSGSRNVEIRLTLYQSVVTLAIEDNGKGIPQDVLERFSKSGLNLGVGLAGMRERVKELGGRLELESGKTGTRLKAIIPIAEAGVVRGPSPPAFIQTSPTRAQFSWHAGVIGCPLVTVTSNKPLCQLGLSVNKYCAGAMRDVYFRARKSGIIFAHTGAPASLRQRSLFFAERSELTKTQVRLCLLTNVAISPARNWKDSLTFISSPTTAASF